MKRLTWWIAALVVAAALVLALEMSRSREIDWTPSYTQDARSPYGTYLLFHLLQTTTPPTALETVYGTTYQALESAVWDGTNYLVINDEYALDAAGVAELVDYVDSGNNVFIAASRISRELLDTLGVKLGRDLIPPDSVRLNFVNRALGTPAGYVVRGESGDTYLKSFDTARTTILGCTAEGRTNFVRITIGSGSVYLSTVPRLFTNYAVIDRSAGDFSFKALSYLPGGTTYWDEHYKAGRSEIRSPFRYLMSHASLSWAYYLSLAAAVLFVFAYARRRQRIIPIVAPPANATMEFVATVGRLYFQHGDHRNLAEKKILYLLDQIQTRYGLRATTRDREFLTRLAERSGAPIEEVTALFDRIAYVEGQERISADELASLATAIDTFYNNRTAS
jgi:hypothetical protein